MSDEEALDDDFDLEDEVMEPDSEERIPVADSDIRRRLEYELEERRLQKMIQDYDFDWD